MQKPWCGYFSKRWINISYWWNWFRFLVSICKVDKPGWMPRRLRAQIAVLGILVRKARARVPFAIFNIIIFFLLSNLFRASQGSPSSRTWYPISFAGHFGEYVSVCVCAALPFLCLWLLNHTYSYASRVCIFNEFSRRKWIHSNTLSIRHPVTSFDGSRWTGVGHVEAGTRFHISLQLFQWLDLTFS